MRKTRKMSKHKRRGLRGLSSICGAEIKDFFPLGNPEGLLSNYVYINNGGNILGVCHLDTVKLPYQFVIANLLGGTQVFSPVLDDRLGVYGLLEELPKYTRVKYDILLTTGEETCNSSAQFFTTSKKYNWIFELDRRGTDCVTYNMQTKEWEDALKSVGWKIGIGSYSDIGDLKRLERCAVNFGIAYQEEHTIYCHANLKVFESQIRKAANFINKYSNTVFEKTYVVNSYPKYVPYYNRYRGYEDDLYNEDYWRTFDQRNKYLLPSEIVSNAASEVCKICGTELMDHEFRAGICDVCAQVQVKIDELDGGEDSYYNESLRGDII